MTAPGIASWGSPSPIRGSPTRGAKPDAAESDLAAFPPHGRDEFQREEKPLQISPAIANAMTNMPKSVSEKRI